MDLSSSTPRNSAKLHAAIKKVTKDPHDSLAGPFGIFKSISRDGVDGPQPAVDVPGGEHSSRYNGGGAHKIFLYRGSASCPSEVDRAGCWQLRVRYSRVHSNCYFSRSKFKCPISSFAWRGYQYRLRFPWLYSSQSSPGTYCCWVSNWHSAFGSLHN